METKPNPKLRHLSELQIETLIARYYGNEKIKVLLSEYQIDCFPSRLSGLFPPEALKDRPCPNCATPMVRKRQSRSTPSYSREVIQCQACGHKEGGKQCRCEHCVADKRRKKNILIEGRTAKARAFCQKTGPQSPHQPAAKDLDLRTVVALLALVRACAFSEIVGEDKTNPSHISLESLRTATIPFTPTIDLGRDLVIEMIRQDLIDIPEHGINTAFEYLGAEIVGVYLEEVRWILTVENPVHLLEDITRLAGDVSIWPGHWPDAVYDLWLEIALAECKQYFRHVTAERGLPMAAEKSTDLMLRTLLQNYSVSQCYRFIWGAAQRAVDFMVRKGCTKQHAANYMVGECQRWADRALAEQWEIKHFKRNFDLPRSSLSHVLFDLFLKIGEDGFNSVPKPGTHN